MASSPREGVREPKPRLVVRPVELERARECFTGAVVVSEVELPIAFERQIADVAGVAIDRSVDFRERLAPALLRRQLRCTVEALARLDPELRAPPQHAADDQREPDCERDERAKSQIPPFADKRHTKSARRSTPFG